MLKVFADRLKWVREKKGITQKEMAEKIGVSQSYYSKFEYDQREPNIETLIKISDTLEEAIDFLVGKNNYDNHGKILMMNLHHQRQSYEVELKRLQEQADPDPELLHSLNFYEDRLKKAKREYVEYVRAIPHHTDRFREYLDMLQKEIEQEELEDDEYL